MKIGIIGGTGPQGLGIAKRLAIAGEDVIVGSRKEEKALTVVGEANEEIKEYNPKELVGMANEDAACIDFNRTSTGSKCNLKDN